MRNKKKESSSLIKEAILAKKVHRTYTVTTEDYRIMQARADKYTGGNMSHWIRYATMNHTPGKSEIG